MIRAISGQKNANYWRLFARKPYLCTPTVCLSNRHCAAQVFPMLLLATDTTGTGRIVGYVLCFNRMTYVQTQEGYENFQMDHVLCETELTATYEFQPVFLGFVSILENFSNGFRIQNHSGYSYFHGKEGM